MSAKEPAAALIDEAKVEYDFVFPTGLVCSECKARVWQAYKGGGLGRLTASLWFCTCTRSMGQIVPGSWQPNQAETAS